MIKGVIGLVSLGLAGAIFFSLLNAIELNYAYSPSMPPVRYGWEWYAIPIWGFITFLLVGLGLWLIIKDARRETKRNP